MIHNLYHFQENLQQQNILWKTRGKAVTISIRRWSPIFPATCKRYISFYLFWLKVYIHSNSSFEKNSIKVYISYRWFSQDMLPFPVKILQYDNFTIWPSNLTELYVRHMNAIFQTWSQLTLFWTLNDQVSFSNGFVSLTTQPEHLFTYLFTWLPTKCIVILWYFLTWDTCPTWGDLKQEFISFFLFVEIVALEPFILLPALWPS